MTVNVERRVGFPHPSQVKAADMLQVTQYDTAPNQPLPEPYTPGRATPESVGIKDPGDGVSLILIGDHGGIEDPSPQKAVASALLAELQSPKPPSAIVSCGDIVYFNGDPLQYAPQFYQPYMGLQVPIVGVPGNHDGDPTDGVTGAGIGTFMANFCAKSPASPPGDPHDEYGRDVQTQPSHDWTLNLKAVTLIGVWSNVKSGGNLYSNQLAWLTTELRDADPDIPVVVYLHHPPYSVDVYNGGSKLMGSLLDGCFETSGRWPDLVAAGHIHDQQMIVRERPGGTTRYIVIGNSGYHNTHAIAGDYAPGMQLQGGVTVPYAWADGWGYLRLNAGQGKLSGQFVQVALDGTVTPAFEFSS